MARNLTVVDLQTLIGNPNAYAIQQLDGTYLPLRERLTPKILRHHLAHEYTVGTYIVKGDRARTLVFDIDTPGVNSMDVASGIRRVLIDSFRIPPHSVGIEFSGKKGHHVWVVLANYVPASQLRRLGQAVALLADFKGEVFPKQDKTVDLGNLVKLPGGLHRVTGVENNFVGDTPRPMLRADWGFVEATIPAEQVGHSPSREYREDRYPCMETCQQEGALTGSRHMELLQLAVMLRRGGVTEDNVRLIVERTNELSEPMDEREIENILSSAPKTGPVCTSVPQERQCGELCISARGLRPWPGRVLQAGVGEGLVVVLKERTEAGTAVFEHPDCHNIRGTLR